MSRNHSRTVLELFAVLIRLTWWMTVVLVPVQLALSLLRSAGVVRLNGLGNLAVPVSVPLPPGVQSASGQIELAALPLATALPAGLIWAGSVLAGLAVLWMLSRVVRGLRLRPLDDVTSRDMRRLGPVILAATVVGTACVTASSAVVTYGAPETGVQLYLPLSGLLWGAVAAAVAVLFAEALRVATAMREDRDLTI